MVDKLIEKTGPAVQLDSAAKTKGERTRERIMDLAYRSIVQKGFAATSIEELVEAAGITKSGFFYHFRDKNDLARQLFERFLAEDESILDTLESRARELSDDPLQSFLIFLNLYAQMMDDMEALHPGCMVATVTYQERMFDAEVRQMNVDYLKRMRVRFVRWVDEIVATYPPRFDIEVEQIADHLNVVVEGAIIQSKALRDETLMGKQTRLFRQYVKLLFGA
ncbi:TetR/AcrR family transcriptional regulator [Sphingomonas hankyongi]|uniref:TetR/AcrR family transcriptional regulator n=1 Tax=Sphingomonas hankyongi TaxID=2908209 RepID=A0ABT0S1K0_9SPHN|nr:TetR/AcrR family transcriptional regulator [Sphingomonas hankyongi]MCL6729538.1 TetR/AcrR family transcriptional regulator [Sphingomonas hankyongi]